MTEEHVHSFGADDTCACGVIDGMPEYRRREAEYAAAQRHRAIMQGESLTILAAALKSSQVPLDPDLWSRLRSYISSAIPV